ncbi:MAG: hypothetical protein PHW11_03855 [Anaerolineaceae bacterium]|jgi:hypothetical protein|nr:hypothetical protein [Anaerolineaceae bacterium]MDD4042626.1 hypothetical protein [Anaerolineaceae bacterium]
MNREPAENQNANRLNGTIWTVVVLVVMVIALVLFVMTNDRADSVTAIALTRTVAYLQTATIEALVIGEPYPVEPLPVVSVNGILITGSLLVMVVLFAVIREAILHKRA